MLLIQFLSPQFNPSLLIMQLTLTKYFQLACCYFTGLLKVCPLLH